MVIGAQLREEDMPRCRFGARFVDAHPVADAPTGSALLCRSPAFPGNFFEFLNKLILIF